MHRRPERQPDLLLLDVLDLVQHFRGSPSAFLDHSAQVLRHFLPPDGNTTVTSTRQHLYLKQVLSPREMMFELGTLPDAHLRQGAGSIFSMDPGRAFRTASRGVRRESPAQAAIRPVSGRPSCASTAGMGESAAACSAASWSAGQERGGVCRDCADGLSPTGTP
ncbi:DUF6082 family protein [Streptomyces sp. S.PB5]|uniref:DUF6082 family protein n=1 Tax=Streptomyces sp. S.PB5 TaxID=3020844 RepID=UPI00339D5C66